MKTETLSRWTAEASAELYGIRNWGGGYFDISEQGEILIRPKGEKNSPAVSMMELVDGLRARGIGMPVLLRFGDILASRIARINQCFARVMKESGYQGKFRGVYPIKVNQQQQVIEDIVAYGQPFHYGLEAGSKAELITALAYCNNPEALIVCNGYKDEEFIDLALYALKMGLQAVMVIEMPSELEMILSRAERMGVTPRIGVRAKLAAKGGGHWNESGGDRSQFGLNAAQIIDLVDNLRSRGKLECLEMLHYHLGSQIPNIRNIRSGIVEASRMYVDLVKEGARMGMLNVGGGLAVDYDGSHSNFASSANYNIDEYAADIIEEIQKTADAAGVPHPTIVSESGRATVAHHSVLLFDIFDVSRMNVAPSELELPAESHDMLKNLQEVNNTLTPKNVQECYHDAVFYRDEVRSLFNQGSVSLRERALAEKIFWKIIHRIAEEIRERKYIPDELEDLETAIADVYFGNFSVFQSLPDSWAIEQLFPIVPIHRLNETPTRKAVLADITCDCDGKIDRFIDLHDVKKTLPLHDISAGGDYFLGVFLVGAYQETLGDLHNLLGDTNVVSVRLGENGHPEYVREISGDTVADVLSYVEYDPKDMVDQMRRTAERAVREGRITPQERRQIMAAYETGLSGYTYFEK
ncbi:MAG TPA: biosynthetic arginine decarboxylase [Kiritimatiellia bacterium]|nr:biosynthetic arginine decarboxylase [Kiritimatiellia bacterium]